MSVPYSQKEILVLKLFISLIAIDFHFRELIIAAST